MATDTDIFSVTACQTNILIEELMVQLGWKDGGLACNALCTTLQALRDDLPFEEAALLGTKLPVLIRGLYYASWNPFENFPRKNQESQFLSRIRDNFKNRPDIDAASVASAVLDLVTSKIICSKAETPRASVRELRI